MAGITGRLGSINLARQQLVAVFATVEFLLVHVCMAIGAFGVHGVTQARRVAFRFLAVTLIAGARLRLDVRTVMTIGTARSILLHVVVMAVRQLAQFRVVTSYACLWRQFFLVVRRKAGVKLRGMARSTRDRSQTRRFAFMVAINTSPSHLVHVFHVSRMGKKNMTTLVLHGQTNREFFRRCWYNLTTNDQKYKQATDNNDWCVAVFQGSVLVLWLDTI